MDGELHFLEIAEIARLLAARKVSPVELTRAMLDRIERLDPALKAYAHVTPELALAQARNAEQMIGRRQILSQLHGVPIAVKDLCCTEGVVTSAGMPLHRDFVPALDATVVRKLREAGAVHRRPVPAHRDRQGTEVRDAQRDDETARSAGRANGMSTAHGRLNNEWRSAQVVL